LSPSTTIGEIFTTFYALAGVACLGIAIGVLGNKMLQSHEDNKWTSHAADAMTFVDASHQNDVRKANCRRRQSAIDKKRQYDFSLVRFLLLVGTTLAFAFAIGIQSGWGFWNVIYYAVVTGCTIGYGDLAPETQHQRFLAILFIPLACAVTGNCLAYFANYVLERQSATYRKLNFEAHSELTVEDLRTMDITGDGKVAWFEFLEFMLIATRKADPEFLDELRDYFDRLDVANTGELSQDTLIEMARRKLRCPRRKLDLSSYKRRLLKQSHKRRRRRDRSPPPTSQRGRGWLSTGLFAGMSLPDLDEVDGHYDRGNFDGPFPRIRRFFSTRQ
jgi:potassium channel subfamily K